MNLNDYISEWYKKQDNLKLYSFNDEDIAWEFSNITELEDELKQQYKVVCVSSVEFSKPRIFDKNFLIIGMYDYYCETELQDDDSTVNPTEQGFYGFIIPDQ